MPARRFRVVRLVVATSAPALAALLVWGATRDPSPSPPAAPAVVVGDGSVPVPLPLSAPTSAPRGSLIEPALRTDGTRAPAPCSRASARSFAFFGDPTTRRVDAVWTSQRCDGEPDVPLQRMPTAMRLVETVAVDNHVYALVESVAVRGQPGGLLTWIDVGERVATGTNAPAEGPGARARIPPVKPEAAAVFAAKGGKAAPSTPWVSPNGVVIEDVFQDTFRRERTKLADDDPRLGVVRTKLASGTYACSWDARLPPPIGQCRTSVAGFSSLAFESPPDRPDGPPLLRALGVDVLRDQLLGPPAPLQTEAEHRRALEAYLARQPIAGQLVAAGPLNRDGGSGGVFFSPSPVPRIYLVAVDGPAGAIYWAEPLSSLDGEGLTARSTVQAQLLGPAAATGHVGTALVRFERAGKRAWTGVFEIPHPLREPKWLQPGIDGVDFVSDRAIPLLLAPSFEAALATWKAPPFRATEAELTTLFAGIGTRAHLAKHAARGAVYLHDPGDDLNRATILPIAAASDEVLAILADRKADAAWRNRARTKPEPKKETFGDDLQEFYVRTNPGSDVSWTRTAAMYLVREDGVLRIQALVEN